SVSRATATGTAPRPEGGEVGPRRHVRALDGLRGAAVVAVVLFHAGHLVGGWLGVDLFFVLSGFLITSLLLEERAARGEVRLGAFWARRARRLLPALLLMLLGVGVYALVFAAPSELSQVRADGLATLGYVANWHQIAHGTSYWDLFRAPSPLEHTWSLAIEEQFYLVWPLVVVAVLAWRRSVRGVLVASLVGAAASFATMLLLYTPGADPQRVYMGTDTRASSILLGAALAALIANRGWTPRRVTRVGLEAAGVVALGFLAWAWWRLSGSTPAVYEGLLLACSAAAAVVVAAAAHPRRGPIAWLFSWRPLAALGLISYGVYLWHWPVDLVVNQARVGVSGWALTGVQVAITLAVALASYRLVEQPIRHGALRGWRIRTLTPVAVGLAAAGVVVATVPPPPLHTNPAAALRHLTAMAHPTATDVTTTTSTVPTPPFHLVVTGDSIAFRLMPAFTDLQATYGYTVTDQTTEGCGLEAGSDAHRLLDGSPAVSAPNCAAHWADEIAQDHPDVVFVSLAGQVVGDWLLNGQWAHLCEPSYDAWYEAQVAAGLRVLTAAGARVAVALPAPTYDVTFRQHSDCLRADEIRAALSMRNVYLVDFRDLVCPADQCQTSIDGITLREDNMHYVGPAAELVVRWLGPRLDQLATVGSSP
ncbi:MAG TPA: acyltransferase family protein, partial [Acidimicrobiia bacterium]